MDDFPASVRAALAAQGLSMRRAASQLNYDVAYLSRVLNGKQSPSPQLLEGLENLLQTNGELTVLAGQVQSQELSVERPGVDADIAHMKSSATHLLGHGDRYGSDMVASAAVQVWRSAQNKLDRGSVPERDQRPYLSAVAESAEVAGWLLFDAGQWDAARGAFLESHTLARHAGDRPMMWFAMDMLAMLGIENDRPGEALRIAEEIIADSRVPPRVALIARVRRGRAFAAIGQYQRATIDLDTAVGALEDSLSPRDPWWVWWIDPGEVSGHSGQAMISAGDPKGAIPKLHYAIEHATPRGEMLYRANLLRGYAQVSAWHEAAAELERISSFLDVISSGRNRSALINSLRLLDQDSRTPAWLLSLVREVHNKTA